MSENKENPSYFAVIPANVRYDDRLKANEKLMYGEITALSSKTGECWASNKYFADLYDVSIKSVSRWINELKDCGYITIDMEYEGSIIKKRIIKLTCGQNYGKAMDNNVYSPIDNKQPMDKKVKQPMDKNVNKPIDKNVQENITRVNITRSNILRETSKSKDLDKYKNKGYSF